MIERYIEVKIDDISGTELADAFAELDPYEMARFFERLMFNTENSHGRIERKINDSLSHRHKDGIKMMKLIGDYAETV